LAAFRKLIKFILPSINNIALKLSNYRLLHPIQWTGLFEEYEIKMSALSPTLKRSISAKGITLTWVI